MADARLLYVRIYARVYLYIFRRYERARDAFSLPKLVNSSRKHTETVEKKKTTSGSQVRLPTGGDGKYIASGPARRRGSLCDLILKSIHIYGGGDGAICALCMATYTYRADEAIIRFNGLRPTG